MRRSATLLFLGFTVLGACSDSDGDLGPNREYDIVSADPAVTIGQDSTRQLQITVLRDGSVALANPVITYVVDDLSIASVNGTGLVTAKKGGTTNVRASFNGETVVVPVTVVPRPVTSVQLTLNFTGKDSGTVFALPGSGASAFLRAEVKAGNEVVYCNALACANHATRTQRIVEFVSLDTTKATIANSIASSTALNSRGQVTARDTSAAYRGFVLRVPADNIADTVWLRLALRPIDSITVRTDSFTVAGTNTRLAYTSNVTQDSSIVLGVNMISRFDSAYSLLANGTPRALRADVTVNRENPPRVTWESANENYAVVDVQGRVTGLRSIWAPGVGTTAAARRATSDEPSCSSAVFKVSAADTAYMYDRVLTRFAIPANFAAAVVPTGCPATTGTPPVPTNVPANVARGVHCTSATSTTAAFCTVVIRATITDPATNAVRRAYFTVNVRQP